MSHPRPLRSDAEALRTLNREVRSPDRLRAHYDVEHELAERLRGSAPEQRTALYGQLYTELFARLPDHPQHKVDPAKRAANTTAQVAFLKPFLPQDSVFVEVGCGDAAVTTALAPYVHAAVGVDVTGTLIDQAATPVNFRFVQTSGIALDLPADYADLVYSNQLMEHLHPDDATGQLREIFRVLKPGGRYICSTPNRVSGPHDISCYFGYEASGFHMREYDHGSLAALFRDVGFRSAQASFSIKGHHVTAAPTPIAWGEAVVSALPRAVRTRLFQVAALRNLAGVRLIGRK